MHFRQVHLSHFMQMKFICLPEARLGAAQVIDSSGNAADDKADSAWVADMINAAESSDRDTSSMHIAMADPRYGSS